MVNGNGSGRGRGRSGGQQNAGSTEQYHFEDVVIPEDDPRFDDLHAAMAAVVDTKEPAAKANSAQRAARVALGKLLSDEDIKGKRIVVGEYRTTGQEVTRKVPVDFAERQLIQRRVYTA